MYLDHAKNLLTYVFLTITVRVDRERTLSSHFSTSVHPLGGTERFFTIQTFLIILDKIP